ncbi:MAG: hypothetical protein FJW20_05475 [Acidimicrobiia bacterium]|nr:hypothetical protein [Acidimicrobiia bacterium]
MRPWHPTAAALLVAAVVAWWACPVPPQERFSLFGLLASSANFVLFLAICTWICLRVFRRRDHLATAAAVWFAPLSIFLALNSRWTTIAAALLSLPLIRLAFRYWPEPPLPAPNPPAEPAIFYLPPYEPWLRRYLPPLFTALLLHAAAFAAMGEYHRLAAAFTFLCAFRLGWPLLSRVQPRPRTLANTAFAAVLVAIGLWPYLLRVPFLPQRGGAEKVAPTAPGPGLFSQGSVQPLSIPFAGVFWIFKAPHLRPPPGSLITRGSLDKLSFRSSDYRTLRMEARQNFGILIDTGCCSRIELALANADLSLNSVTVELILIDTTRRGKPMLSLGKAVTGKDGPQTLSFDMPSNPVLDQFDEALVKYTLSAGRAHRSAKIAIRRFVLVPSGV